MSRPGRPTCAASSGHEPDTGAGAARAAGRAGRRLCSRTRCTATRRCGSRRTAMPDVWIELLHAMDLEPHAMLAFTLAVDFEGDQWTFFKPTPGDLWALYGRGRAGADRVAPAGRAPAGTPGRGQVGQRGSGCALAARRGRHRLPQQPHQDHHRGQRVRRCLTAPGLLPQRRLPRGGRRGLPAPAAP
jgi:hypothetical protein